jgi:hypothetical protein
LPPHYTAGILSLQMQGWAGSASGSQKLNLNSFFHDII